MLKCNLKMTLNLTIHKKMFSFENNLHYHFVYYAYRVYHVKKIPPLLYLTSGAKKNTYSEKYKFLELLKL